MPVPVSYPGVYIQEVPSGVRTITGVSTSIGMFVGMTNNGPLDQPTRVLSFAEYEREFGTDVSSGEMTDQVRQFFLNGGRQAYIARIADGPAAATATLQDEFGNSDVIELEARSAGAIGGTVRVQVDYRTSSPDSLFNLIAFRDVADGSGVIQVVELETFTDLTMRPTARKYAVDELNLRSNLLTARSVATPPMPVSGFSVAGTLMSTGGSGLAELTNIINAADPVTNTGSFQISVDGSAFVTATISVPASTSPADVDAAITNPVRSALAVTGTSVNATIDAGAPFAGFHVLRITSTSTDGSVRILPALTRDIAVPMQMGAAQGGFEVDGYAVQRPAPTGLFSTLGTSLGDTAAIESFAQIDPANITQFDMTDANPGTSPTNSATGLVWPAASVGTGDRMTLGSRVGDEADSLLNLAENLDALVTQINASPIPWTALRAGLRIGLTPDYGGADADMTGTIATSATDIGPGGAGEIFDQAPNTHSYRLGAPLPSTYQTAGLPGNNGSFPQLGDYTDIFEVIAREVDLFNLMVLPRAAGQSDAVRSTIWPRASAFCHGERAFLLMDPPEDWLDVSDAVAGVTPLRTGLLKDHAAVFWPRLVINAPEGGQRTVDPSGSIAGLAARIDSNRGVWKAPAGIEAALLGVRGIEHAMSDAENGVINPEAVNAIRAFPNGIVSWGSRTMDGFDNSGNDDYKYVPVRRFALFIEESLYRGLKFAVFEPNAEPLWAQIRLAAGAFMNNLFRQGAFKGEKKSDAYFVKVDSETTTQNDINLGIVNVVVGFAPLKPAEFVVVTIQQMAGQIEV